jgi:hypothetical protein
VEGCPSPKVLGCSESPRPRRVRCKSPSRTRSSGSIRVVGSSWWLTQGPANRRRDRDRRRNVPRGGASGFGGRIRSGRHDLGLGPGSGPDQGSGRPRPRRRAWAGGRPHPGCSSEPRVFPRCGPSPRGRQADAFGCRLSPNGGRASRCRKLELAGHREVFGRTRRARTLAHPCAAMTPAIVLAKACTSPGQRAET